MKYISKTDYLLWRACPKNAWLRIADLAHLYSNKINMFFDHGYGQLSLAVHSERNGPISIRVERLSADLELEKETIEISHTEY
jgi:hypothetical protein